MKVQMEQGQGRQARDVVSGYYADQLLAAMVAVSEAQERAVQAARALKAFTTTAVISPQDDPQLIAMWCGKRVGTSGAQELRGVVHGEVTERLKEERLVVMKWLVAQGCDIGPVFAEELQEAIAKGLV